MARVAVRVKPACSGSPPHTSFRCIGRRYKEEDSRRTGRSLVAADILQVVSATLFFLAGTPTHVRCGPTSFSPLLLSAWHALHWHRRAFSLE